MDRITIIGMGPIGASLGLALKEANLSDTEIVGTSAKRQASEKALKMGAVDQTTNSLREAVRGAELVILDTGVSETRELLEAIGPILNDRCVITDTGTVKKPVMEWADEYLPRGVSYVGGHPLPKNQPHTLDDADAGVFKGSHYCVIPAKSAKESSIRTVVGLVETVGAKPLFLDPHEHDSYAAAMTYMPIVLSSAFVTTTSGSEAWREMYRMAGPEFGEFSNLASMDPGDNEAACLVNPDALVHWLDRMITELYQYRNHIKERDDKLLENLVHAWEARARWEAGIEFDDDQARGPSSGESFATFFVGSRLVERYKEIRDKDKNKKTDWKNFRKF